MCSSCILANCRKSDFDPTALVRLTNYIDYVLAKDDCHIKGDKKNNEKAPNDLVKTLNNKDQYIPQFQDNIENQKYRVNTFFK